jgi:hypothetical protein
MFKIFTRVIIIVLVILVSIKITYAAFNISKGFGGKITQTKATEIQNAESAGYTCKVPGTSITIKPVGNYPTTYVIPSSVKSKTNTTTRSNQWILGLYSQTKTTITCTKPCPPPPGNECIKTVSLNTISLFGTSK